MSSRRVSSEVNNAAFLLTGRDTVRKITNDNYEMIGDGYILTRLWLIQSSKSKFFIAKCSDIIWVYPVSTNHSENGVHTGTTYGITICLKNRKTITLNYGYDKATADWYYDRIYHFCPWVMLGYTSADDEYKWHANPINKIAEAEKRRKDVMPYLETAYPSALAENKQSDLIPIASRLSIVEIIQEKIIPIVAIIGGTICILYFLLLLLLSGSPVSSHVEQSDNTSKYSQTYSTPVLPTTEEPSESPSSDSKSNAHAASLKSWQIKIALQKETLKSLSEKIDSYEASIKKVESSYKQGKRISRSHYSLLIKEHNTLVSKYNSLLKEHKSLVKKYNKAIDEYNNSMF